MRTNTFYRLSYNLYHSLEFYQHYSTTLQKNVFKSNYICGGNWYFNIKIKSYMYTNLGVIIPNQSAKYYVELVLLLKTSVCTQNNSFFMPSTLQTSLYTDPYAKAYKEYKKKKKMKEKQEELDELEDSLEDKESELEERERKLKLKEKKLRSKKRKTSKKKSSKKKSSKKKKSKIKNKSKK